MTQMAQIFEEEKQQALAQTVEEIIFQFANALIKSKKHSEFKERHHRIKFHRGHKEAVIAACKMLLTAIWNMLSKLEPYNSNGFLEHGPVNGGFTINIENFSDNIDIVSEMGYNTNADMMSEYNEGKSEYEKEGRITISFIPDSCDCYRSHERRETYMDTGGTCRHRGL